MSSPAGEVRGSGKGPGVRGRRGDTGGDRTGSGSVQGLERGVEMDVFVVGWLCWQMLVSRLGFPPCRKAGSGRSPSSLPGLRRGRFCAAPSPVA